MLPLVEGYANGYPRFSALMAAHDGFLIFRRFSNLYTRLLLHAQDKVVQLEARLDRIDTDEQHPLFLASTRRDRNTERQAIMEEIHEALITYGRLHS